MPSYRPVLRQHRSKAVSGTARAEIAVPQFLVQFLIAVNEAESLANFRFGWVATPPLGDTFGRRLKGRTASPRTRSLALSRHDLCYDTSECPPLRVINRVPYRVTAMGLKTGAGRAAIQNDRRLWDTGRPLRRAQGPQFGEQAGNLVRRGRRLLKRLLKNGPERVNIV
jgi:hypothetical protein